MNILNRTMPNDIYEIYMRIKNDIKYEIMMSESNNERSYVSPPFNGCVHMKLNNNETEDEYFWEIFLHEHIHVIQYQENYKDMISHDKSKKIISEYINNVIMDIDVNRRLLNVYKYRRKSKCSEKRLALNIVDKIIKCRENGFSDQDIIMIVISIVLMSTSYNSKYDNLFISNINELNRNAGIYYRDFMNAVYNNPIIGYRSIRKIQDQAADIFHLGFCKFQ